MNRKKKKYIITIGLLLVISLTHQDFSLKKDIEEDSRANSWFLNQANNDSWSREWKTRTYGRCIGIDSAYNVLVGCDDLNGYSIVKYNSSGTELWNVYYGLWVTWEFNHIVDMVIDSNDNIYTVGWALGEMIGWDPICYLVKHDKLGEFIWEVAWSNYSHNFGVAVAIDSSDNVYMLATSYSSFSTSDIFLVKYNSAGNELWTRSWGGNYEDWGDSIAIDSLDNIYVLGTRNSTRVEDYDIFLLKFDNSGGLLWNRTWGGSQNDYGFDMILDSSENINILGSTASHGKEHTFLIKYDNSGAILWNKTFLGNRYTCFALDSLDNLYFTSTEEFFANARTDIYLVKYNSLGDFKWDLIWGKELDDYCEGIAIDLFDNIYITGTSWKNMIIVKNPEDKSEYSPPSLFTLEVSSEYVNPNSAFLLNWTSSRGADNFSIYVNDDYFRDIDNSATLLDEGIIDHNYRVSGLPEGTYFFIAVAHNKNGYTTSNCVYVIILTGGMEFYQILLIFMGIGIVYIVGFTIVYRRMNFRRKTE